MTDSLGSRQSLWHAQSTDFSPGVLVWTRCRTILDLMNALDQKEKVLPLALLCNLHVCVPQGPFLINDKKLQWAMFVFLLYSSG